METARRRGIFWLDLGQAGEGSPRLILWELRGKLVVYPILRLSLTHVGRWRTTSSAVPLRGLSELTMQLLQLFCNPRHLTYPYGRNQL